MPKINRKLTETEIKNAKPKDKAYKLYDEGGLEILVRPSGTKVWRYPFKLNNKRNTFTIGKYGSGAGYITSAEARSLRNEARALVEDGIDPIQYKKDLYRKNVEAHDNSFEALAREWYSKQSWAPKHAKNIMSRLEKDVFVMIGRKPIKDVNVRDILDVLKKIEDRGALDVAQRINQYCTAIFDYAIIQGICDNNPALGRSKFIKAYKKQNRPHLAEKELPSFIKNLNEIKNPSLTILAVKLLILTVVRPGELRGARWDEINEEEGLWEIPPERMKMDRPHIVPLSKQAMVVIKEIKSYSGNYEILFPGKKRITQPISDVALIKAIKKLSNDKAVPHGFRHTASTIMNEKGFNRDHIEMILAHAEDNKVRGTYNKAKYIEQRREILQWWADYLATIL